MKILYHHRTASKDGQAVHIEELIAALRAQGHEVHVVAPGEVGEDAGTMGQDMDWVHRLKARLPKAAYELMELSYSWLAYRKLMAAARIFQPDVIYERYNLFLLAGLMASRRLKVPLLLEVNAPLVQERSKHSGGLALQSLARWAEGHAWRGASWVLPVTQVLADHVRAYGVPDARIAVIPNGINEAHFQAAPASDEAKARLGLQGRLVLGFTGFVRDWHGVDRVIAWMAGTTAPRNSHLLVVGDGPVREELQDQARQLGIADRVTFTGVVHRDQVPAHVSAFDVALQPAVVAYASPLKLMEYLVLGKAIVAPRVPNLLEVLTEGQNAHLFEQDVPGAFEAALACVCGDAALRLRLERGARDTIGRLRLTWDGNAQRVVSLAQEAVRSL
ncbi:glycosyltransferase family 4 protein [Pseudorhodoferax sp. Leaf274]|uniref:glycosyltransferase family 4 protein n=1 Tax=Pseudorhodoferax sp. Leaf274 TaxID=1736318 RepID=UPI0007035A00|nr:glycosyltransferase family 4 protein [Pseudorhodoferax sp. Leaf274]KQP39772.1 glycosyl transferase family 1 [Pseudorhodoferax sp. Leaf274]